MFYESRIFYLFVLCFKLVGKDNQTDIALLSVSCFLNSIFYVLDRSLVIKVSHVHFDTFELDFEISRSTLECINQRSCFLAGEVKNSAFDAMFIWIDRFVKEIEKCLFSFLYCIIVSKIEFWHRNNLAFDSFKVFADIYTHILKRAKIFISPQLFHKFQYLFLFFISRLDGILRNFFSSELIKVLGDSSHKAKLWDKEYLEVFVLPTTFYFEQRLLFVCYFEIVLLLVIIFQAGWWIFQNYRIYFLEHNFFNFVVGCFAIVSHNNFTIQLSLQ